MAILLPVVAILSVTSEWSQRTGLITFTLVPHRGQIILAQGDRRRHRRRHSMLLAFAIGALGNVVGSHSTAWNRVGPQRRRLPVSSSPTSWACWSGSCSACSSATPLARSWPTSSTRSCCRDLRSAGGIPGLVQGHPAVDRLRLRAGTAVDGWPTGEQWAQIGVSDDLARHPADDRHLGGAPLRGQIGQTPPWERMATCASVSPFWVPRARSAPRPSRSSPPTPTASRSLRAAGGDDPALLAKQALEPKSRRCGRQGERRPGRTARALRRGPAAGLPRATIGYHDSWPDLRLQSTPRARPATSC